MVHSNHVLPLLVLCLATITLFAHFWTVSTERVLHIDTDHTLRILPLGDSLTWGLFSHDGNGYRLKLQELLAGQHIHYLGSQRSGNMVENANEGHNGATISQVAEFAQPVLSEKPDVVLLMAGINDFLIPYEPNTAANRIILLIDHIIQICPRATVLVAQIPGTVHVLANAFVQPYNMMIQNAVAERAEQGRHIMVVDMHSRLTLDDLIDGIHPTDQGFELMAQAWSQALQTAINLGWTG